MKLLHPDHFIKYLEPTDEQRLEAKVIQLAWVPGVLEQAKPVWNPRLKFER